MIAFAMIIVFLTLLRWGRDSPGGVKLARSGKNPYGEHK